LPKGSAKKQKITLWYHSFDKMAAMTSSFDQIAWNLIKQYLISVRLFLKSFVEIGLVVLPNNSRHTDTYTKNVLLFISQNGRHDVIIWWNCFILIDTRPDLCETIFGKFRWNPPSSFALTTLDTHTHTQTDTHTQTPPVFSLDTIPIHLVNEMTKCKKIKKEGKICTALLKFIH